MKRRFLAGLLTAVMVCQVPISTMAAEMTSVEAEQSVVEAVTEEKISDMQDVLENMVKEEIASENDGEDVELEVMETEQEIVSEEIVEEEEVQPLSAFPTVIDLRSLPYHGEINDTFEMGGLFEKEDGQVLAFNASAEDEVLNTSEHYSAILPSLDSVDKYGFRGDQMNLYFNLFSRGNATDMWFVAVHKGDIKGDIIGSKNGYFDAEPSLINMTLGLNTSGLQTGTYTVESYMKYNTGNGYVTDQETHYRFEIHITDVRTPLDSITLNTTGQQLRIGQELNLEVTYSPEDTTEDTKVKWTTSNSGAGEFYEDLYSTQGGVFEATGYGTTYITAQMGDKTAVCVITVSEESDPSFPFTDIAVKKGSWQYDNVKYVYDKGIMNGISGTTWFQPNNPLTRAMFATVLYRMAGSPNVNFGDRFSDVAAGQYYSDAVIWANDKGIVSGYTDGSYGVNKNITREQIAKMLFEYAKSNKYDVSMKKSLSSFTDENEVSNWATEYMEWATAVGLITGKPNGDGTYRLDPKGEATRAECAKMLAMFDQKY